MTPPTNFGLDVVDAATIDGQNVSAVTMDGDEVFGRAIPDSGDLFFHYDATQSSTVSEFTQDLSGNGNDLTTVGSPTLTPSGINGKNSISLDGSDDGFDGPDAPSGDSPPYLLFAVWDITDNGNENDLWGQSDPSNSFVRYRFDTNDILVGFGNSNIGSSPVTTAHIQIVEITSGTTNDRFRIDGSDMFTGDLGTNNLDKFALGYTRKFDNRYTDGQLAEAGAYVDIGSRTADLESYLANKYGITI